MYYQAYRPPARDAVQSDRRMGSNLKIVTYSDPSTIAPLVPVSRSPCAAPRLNPETLPVNPFTSVRDTHEVRIHTLEEHAGDRQTRSVGKTKCQPVPTVNLSRRGQKKCPGMRRCPV